MKMETPKMDVVRFQEADVLAASPNIYTTVLGFNNETQKDGGVAYKNQTYFTKDAGSAAALEQALNNDGIYDVRFTSEHGEYSIAAMWDLDINIITGEQSIPLVDGEYVYRDGMFHKITTN